MRKTAQVPGILIHLFWLLVGMVVFPALAGAAPFSITSAEWSDSFGGRLSVAGTGTSRDSVTVDDADTGATLASVRVSRYSTWNVTVRRPSTIPCRVRATQSDGSVAVAPVANAPASCAPPNIAINDVTVNEGGTANFTVTLSAPSSQTVTVVASTADNTAHAGTNYVAKTATLTFAPGTTSQTFSVSTIDDHVVTGTLSFFVNLSGASNATISDSQGIGSILNVDQAVTPAISINNVTVNEGQTATFTVRLSAASTQTVTVVASTADNTAHAGTNYVAKTATLTFAPGTTSQTFSVSTIDDNVMTGTLSFFVNLSGASNATISDNQGIGSIQNIDQAAGAALSINNVTVNAGQTANFTVTLSTTSTSTVTVVASTANNTAVAGTDYTAKTATLTFAPGTTAQTFSVTTLATSTTGTAKTFYVNLTNPSNATISDAQGVGTINQTGGGGGGGTRPGVSINSTSQNSATIPSTPVAQHSMITNSGYQVFAMNDLGMHCDDLDARISSILPPFNVLHAQVVKKGDSSTTLRLGQSQVSVVYSAAANPTDPILSNPAAILDGNFNGVYKTNFWDVARSAYDPFYPAGVLPQFYPNNVNILDLGLPVPDLEQLYLGNGQLTATQQKMPGINAPYSLNETQPFTLFTGTEPYFSTFAYGYNTQVNWFEAAGIPLTTFDDAGRENAYPLMRVQAVAASGNTLGVSPGTILGTLDAVAPVSGEANCQGCHAAAADGGNGSGIAELSATEVSINDPKFGQVPLPVSIEWASDKNVLKLHDLKQGTHLIAGTTQDFPTPGTAAFKPVVCQTCHYTPALDLAQLGPQNSNGLQQLNNKTMSNVIHSYHANLTFNGQLLFPAMPPPPGRDLTLARSILEHTCYQCHPGKRTQCLRGAMGQAGVMCQDCHGGMAQVGNDYSRNQPGGGFLVSSDFYTNPNTPRVPWVNEPSCGSCHTGDATSNLASSSSVYTAPDGLRLLQAYRIGDTKATPIVPTNKRFAEPVVASTGNPMLFKLSTGHGGVLCESCHGSTHAIWATSPMNPAANDNIAPTEAQGHAGTIMECGTCHSSYTGNNLNGPHGMHPVGSSSWVSGHDNVAEGNSNSCRTCHGQTGQGTVLSMVPVARTIGSRSFAAGEEVSCGKCHNNYLAGTGGTTGGD